MPMWLMPVSAAAPVSAGMVVCSAGGVVSVVVVDSCLLQPTAARAMVSDYIATIARANSFRIFTIHLLSSYRAQDTTAARSVFSYMNKDTTVLRCPSGVLRERSQNQRFAPERAHSGWVRR